MKDLNKRFKIQHQALRDPIDVAGANWQQAGIDADSLKFRVSGQFSAALEKSGRMLVITREYEHLILTLSVHSGRVKQTIFPLPHPSGIAVCQQTHRLYVAATRNPNQLIEFQPAFDSNKGTSRWLPSRIKYYPGSTYFHDLAFLKGELYGNSVGQNGLIKVDFNKPGPEPLVWWPKCVEKADGTPDNSVNYIQLNSIAAGNTPEESFFTASSDKISARRPGHLNYPVNKRGVLFSGKTRKTVVSGLTRPHSAKFHEKKIWLNNSGYGELGYTDDGKFRAVGKFPGWTRGLSICGNYAFIGISRILPKYAHYAPGLKGLKKQYCGIFAFDMKSGNIVGSLTWPFANQIFAVESADPKIVSGFPCESTKPLDKGQLKFFYQ